MASKFTKPSHAHAGESTMDELATKIVQQTAEMTSYLSSNGHDHPDFAPDSVEPPETAEYLALHSSLSSCLDDLQRLIDGPRRNMRQFVMMGNDLAALQVAFNFDLFQLVPLEEDGGRGAGIDVLALADKAGIDADRTARVLRMLATHRVFVEPKPGHFAHTAASAVFHRDEELRCAGHYMLVKTIQALVMG